MTITEAAQIDDPDGALWKSYETAFTEINSLAAQRHLLTPDEFAHTLNDDRILKYVADDDTGTLVGHAVITDDLDAWPLIAPAYFDRRWPTEYAARRIFYIGWVCTLPGAPMTTFRDLIAAMSERVFAADGIAVMDFCTHNVNRRMPQVVGHILTRLNPQANHSLIDAQEFHAWRFDGKPWLW